MRRVGICVAVLVAAFVAFLPGGPVAAGEITSSGSTYVFSCPGTSGYWMPPGCLGQDGETNSTLNVKLTATSYSGTYQLHSQCGTAAGVVLTTNDSAEFSFSGSPGTATVSAGTCGGGSASSILLRVWLNKPIDPAVPLLEWKSRMLLSPVNAGCPSDAPSGSFCVWAVNGGGGTAASPSPCPSGVTTSYECVYAVNATQAPADFTPVTTAVGTQTVVIALGIALLLFCLGWGLLRRFRG